MKPFLIAYFPVLHQGYLNWLDQHRVETDTLMIFGPEMIAKFDHLKRKDLRAVDPVLMRSVLAGLFPKVELLHAEKAKRLAVQGVPIIMPDEPECLTVAADFFRVGQVVFEPVFLRWHKENTIAQSVVAEDVTISAAEFDRQIMSRAFTEAKKSLDWWRQVGGVLMKDDRIILVAYNRHTPDERMPYINGDPRANFKKGLAIELSTALHAELAIVAEAAKQGIALLGASLYVTTFPCPPCAKAVAYSGIKKLFFAEGYSMLHGEDDLRSQGVEIVRVLMGPVEPKV